MGNYDLYREKSYKPKHSNTFVLSNAQEVHAYVTRPNHVVPSFIVPKYLLIDFANVPKLRTLNCVATISEVLSPFMLVPVMVLYVRYDCEGSLYCCDIVIVNFAKILYLVKMYQRYIRHYLF